MSTRGGEFCRKHGCGYVGRCPACTQDELLAYRSGHSIGFGCAAIDSETARLRRDLYEALEMLRLAQDDICGEYCSGENHWPSCVKIAAILAKYPG